MSFCNSFEPRPVVIESERVRLEPLDIHHADDLAVAADEAEIWAYMPLAAGVVRDDCRGWIEATHRDAADGSQVPFAIVDRLSGRAVGSTRYLNIRRAHRSLEIGYTWLGSAARRTPINTHCKWLLLSHAFDTLGAIRVEFKTDNRNARSQRALERIGATREGLHRQHMIMPDGHLRDSVYYSIIDKEWTDVSARLQQMLSAASG
ncbi:MAG TPA: GNAT family protein [Phycisphaerae bacterium]|nr:GNAT family protein [Phycisphaerae bacterium]